MKIALINGSPKAGRSASGLLLDSLRAQIGSQAETASVTLRQSSVPQAAWDELRGAGAWVLAFPLYVDAVPGHLLSCLTQLEAAGPFPPETHLYGIVNCGFFEGIQNEPALEILRNWCRRAGVVWGGGLGVGGGGGLTRMPETKRGRGPRAPVEKELAAMAGYILQGETRESRYVSVAFPKPLYRMAAQWGWRQRIRANGGKARDLSARPE